MSAERTKFSAAESPVREIRRLDESVINHIAAGEVVERPASVVKELLENALDAGATEVQVTIEDGGRKKIVVTDNGCGIAPESMATALERHATSKIIHQDDLTRLRTLGFRGEALSSIAAVSRLAITSRRAQDSAATRLTTEGGRVVASGLIGAPVGTQIVVDDLFFNTSPRRKFLRAPATEQAHIYQALLRVALGARKGGFQLEVEDRRLLRIGVADVAEPRILRALGNHIGPLHPLLAHDESLAITGFLSDPRIERGKGGGLWLFVNGRFVRDRMLQRAFLEALELSRQQNSLCAVIFIDLPADAVDVNVHPQKLEVRFDDSALIYRTLARAAAEAKSTLGPQTIAPSENGVGAVARAAQSYFMSAQSIPARGAIHLRSKSHLTSNAGSRSTRERESLETGSASKPRAFVTPQLPLLPEVTAPGWLRPLALSPPGFLTGTSSDRLVLIDLVQAFRQLAFADLAERDPRKKLPREPLILPTTFTLPEAEVARFESRTPQVKQWGLEIRRVGRLTFCLVEASAVWKDALSVESLQQMGRLVVKHDASMKGEEDAREVGRLFVESLEEPRWGDTAEVVWKRLMILMKARGLDLRDVRGVAFVDSEQAFALVQKL